jgi:integrase
MVGFAGALRRSELVRLDVSDLTEAKAGLQLRIRVRKPIRTARCHRSHSFWRGYLSDCCIEYVVEHHALKNGAIFRSFTKDGLLPIPGYPIMPQQKLSNITRIAQHSSGHVAHILGSGEAKVGPELHSRRRDLLAARMKERRRSCSETKSFVTTITSI